MYRFLHSTLSHRNSLKKPCKTVEDTRTSGYIVFYYVVGLSLMVVGLQNIVSFKPDDHTDDHKAGGGGSYPKPPCDYNETLIWCVNQVYEAAECVWLSTLDLVSLGMMFYLFKHRVDYTGEFIFSKNLHFLKIVVWNLSQGPHENFRFSS